MKRYILFVDQKTGPSTIHVMPTSARGQVPYLSWNTQDLLVPSTSQLISLKFLFQSEPLYPSTYNVAKYIV